MKEIEEQLIRAGYKMTKPRQAVLAYFSRNHLPISARALHASIKSFDRASIYRTLNLFEELHIVNVDIVEKEKIYCYTKKPHHHIICSKCGYLESFNCDHSFGPFKNFTNVYHQLTVTGVCKKCSS